MRLSAAGAIVARPGLPNATVGTSPVAASTTPSSASPSGGRGTAGASSCCQEASAVCSPTVLRTVSSATADSVAASSAVNWASADRARLTSTETSPGRIVSAVRAETGITALTATSTFSGPEGNWQV
ncbi:hypothetical protein LUR56_01730 [Streptomyces sp. MT29]|nr:hypothetical protein [Streptomyces sp. MT29]